MEDQIKIYGLLIYCTSISSLYSTKAYLIFLKGRPYLEMDYYLDDDSDGD